MTKASTGNKASTGSGNKASTGSGNKGSGRTPLPADPTPPRPVRLAAKLMLAGAAGTLVSGLYGLIVVLSDRAAALKNFETIDHLTASRANSEFIFSVVVTIIECIVAVALWVWMGRASRSGHGWARIAASVLFVVWTYDTYVSFSGAHGVVGIINLIIMLIIWGIGGTVIAQLWRPESSAYFKSFSR